MKIEKINDNQIRCTLTKEDLDNRNLKVSELAYGTEKARDLFQDMMRQANYEFGFETDDLPLMIEAIPVSTESIILLITKVEYPEELDTRFSRFSEPPADLSSMNQEVDDMIAESADDILSLFNNLTKTLANAEHTTKENIPESSQPADHVSFEHSADTQVCAPVDLKKLFAFKHLEDLIRVSSVIAPFYQGANTLYKDGKNSQYLLMLHMGQTSPENFNKICNILTEYAKQLSVSVATENYLDEHLSILHEKDAISCFANIC